jgi:chorismate synthase
MDSFGRIFRFTTFGESHGPGIGCVVDGCPSGLSLSVKDIQAELDKRRPGQSRLTTARKEPDHAELLSGVFEGRTTGAPIGVLIRNEDADSSKYAQLRDVIRPGHADFTWRLKYGWVDHRGGGRSSGRETACRVAAGAVAKKLLAEYGIAVAAYSKEIAGVEAASPETFGAKKIRELVDASPVKSPDKKAGKRMEDAILAAKEAQDSVGGIIEAVAFGVPPGLGEPVYGKLDADLAAAMLSIPAAKGVEFGAGFSAARMTGSESNDEFTVKDGKIVSKTNRCGGILGGISTGMPLVFRVAIKPTSSIAKKQKTVNLRTMKENVLEIEGRHDPCIVLRAVPVVEAMASLVLADHGIISGAIPRRLL